MALSEKLILTVVTKLDGVGPVDNRPSTDVLLNNAGLMASAAATAWLRYPDFPPAGRKMEHGASVADTKHWILINSATGKGVPPSGRM